MGNQRCVGGAGDTIGPLMIGVGVRVAVADAGAGVGDGVVAGPTSSFKNGSKWTPAASVC